MIPGQERRSFVLSVTLTELALLLFFLLLLTAMWQLNRLERQNEGMILLVAQAAGADPAVLREKIEAAAKNAEAVRENVELRERISQLEAEQSGIQMLLEERNKRERDDFVELVRTAARNTVAALENSQLREMLAGAEEKRDSLSEALQRALSENANLRNQIRNIERRVGQGGIGFPPCWADEDGKPEYIFTVVLQEQHFSVLPAWPPHREDDFHRVTGAAELLRSNLNRAQFAQLARPVLEWSRAQDPECRHFVRINDRPTMSKEAFKANLLLVEDFFYKFLPADRHEQE